MMRGAISGTQMMKDAISGTQMMRGAISGTQKQSVAITHLGERHPERIRLNATRQPADGHRTCGEEGVGAPW